MTEYLRLRSVSFDTSFLLKNDPVIDTIMNQLAKEGVRCFITTTVASELEQLHAWGRISKPEYKQALKRWAHVHATVIDFKNRLLSDAFSYACVRSMEKYHGVQPKDIINDCTIVVSTLKNGVDLFLSEDYHFTSEITKQVLTEVTNAACTEYHQMCDTHLYCIDARTFLASYQQGTLDLDVVRSRMQSIRKKEKRFTPADSRQ